MGGHHRDEADEQKRAEMENDRAHESARGDAALGGEKTRPDRGCDEQQRNQRSRGGAEQHVKVMLTAVVMVEEFACMSRLCRVQGSLATTSPFRVREMQSFLVGMSASQPSPSA